MKLSAITLLSLFASPLLAAELPEGTTATVQLGSTDAINTLKDDGTEGLGDIFTWDRMNKIYKTNDANMISSMTPFADNHGHCIRLTNAGDSSMWDCTFTVYFSDGQVHAQGPFTVDATVVAITGGTGVYTGATGTMGLSFASTHNADGSFNATGIYYSYNYVFDIDLDDDDDGDSDDDRRLRGF